MANGLVSFIAQQYADWAPTGEKPEKSTLRLPVELITAANLVAQTAEYVTLLAAIDALLIGRQQETTITLQRNVISSQAAATSLAQIENKWLVRYHDDTTLKQYRAELPTADLTLLTTSPEFLDITGGPGAALVAAMQATVRAEDTGNQIVVDSVQFVGRNL